MMNLLVNEWIKFRASKTVVLTLLTSICIPLLVAFVVVILNASTSHDVITVDDIMGMNLRFLLKTIGLIFYPYLAADIIAREYYYDTLKFQLTIPISREHFYFAKVAFVTLVTLIFGTIHFVLALVSTKVLLRTTLDFSSTISYWILFLKGNFLMLPFSYFALTLTVIFRKKFIPMSISITMFLTGILFSRQMFSHLLPWTMPTRLIFVDRMQNVNFSISYTYLTLYLFAIISFFTGYKHLMEDEI
ncbi:MAG: ABC transporter permease [Clostridia bacterium]|nr:ABC transporter permease [Clostridia bacterium]